VRHDERLGTLDDVRAAIEPKLLPVFEALLDVADEIDPESTLVATPTERGVYITLGRGKMTDGYAYLIGHRAHVNLGFFRGTDLPDPGGRLEGAGKRLRHLKVDSVATAHGSAVRDLLTAARDHMLELKGRP
jgi:hypothetical protein